MCSSTMAGMPPTIALGLGKGLALNFLWLSYSNVGHSHSIVLDTTGTPSARQQPRYIEREKKNTKDKERKERKEKREKKKGQKKKKKMITHNMWKRTSLFPVPCCCIRLPPATHFRYVTGCSWHGAVIVAIVVAVVDDDGVATVRAPPCSDQLFHRLAKPLVLCVRLLATRHRRCTSVIVK